MTSNEPEREDSQSILREPGAQLQGRRILLGVTGSIAAYKAVLLLRLLKKAGATIEVILTDAATRFVGAATFTGLGAKVHTDMFSAPGELHVQLGREADAFLIAPATADTLARLRQGRADDLLTATALCRRGPLIVAPAMHPRMWDELAVKQNVEELVARGVEVIGPVLGEVASGDVGMGRMAEPERIATELVQLLRPRQSLARRHLVVTAGPTSEPLDPVRSLTNKSSGKMGFAIAAEAAQRGARVTLIAGPVALGTPWGVTRIDVQSAIDMQEALLAALRGDLSGADALVMSAAVADFRPKSPSETKLKRDGQDLVLELEANPDLLAGIGGARVGKLPVLIGFALETADDDELVALARRKLAKKRVDLVVANSAAKSLGKDESKVFFVTPDETLALAPQRKRLIAGQLIDWVASRLTALAVPPRSGT